MSAPFSRPAGRLARLRDELAEEIPVLAELVDAKPAVLEEIDYALRPIRHEHRTPTYGVFVEPAVEDDVGSDTAGLSIVTDAIDPDGEQQLRMYADGLASWAVRTRDGAMRIVVFDRAAGSERDLVVLAAASGATVVQRHPSGTVRIAGDFGVVRHLDLRWHLEPPIERWMSAKTCGVPGGQSAAVVEQLLRFAVHDLGASGVGAVLVYRTADPDESTARRVERRLSSPPPLSIMHPSDLSPLRHVLSQRDGAAVFDESGRLVEIGVRLSPSRDAESNVEALRGTRHTSARRYSYDDPSSVVITISDEGPVTVFRAGDILGRSGGET